jgi:hypothetical protein
MMKIVLAAAAVATVSADCYVKGMADSTAIKKCYDDSEATETCSSTKAAIWCVAHQEAGCTWDDADKILCTASVTGDCDATCDGATTLAISAVAVAAVLYNM